MGIARATYYREPVGRLNDAELLAAITAICDEFEAYGWRRVPAALRHQGVVANHKRIKRLMREHDLQPRRRRRYVATTDSAHDLPIFPDLAKTLVPAGPDQLWVADLT
jgi:putative transposase